MTETLLQCYNKGCGQKFDPNDNKEDSCQFHPGGPIFHDALKGWSCCKKRSTDFSEFLSTPGCTRGRHSNVKPEEPKKPSPAVTENNEQDSGAPNQPTTEVAMMKPTAQPMVRPSTDEPMIKLNMTVADSLKQALEKQLSEMSLTSTSEQDKSNQGESGDDEVTKGTSCKNNSCTAVYEGESSNKDMCCYHPGVPVFHEGMKYWSCCERKTTEFTTFLSQTGCASGKHVWKKKDDDASGEKKVACRYDWHQTGSFVTLSIFAKLSQPHKTVVEANKVSVKVDVLFDAGKSHFIKHFVLHGIVDPEKSSVKMLGTKVEINLKKMEAGSWAKLELQSVNQG